MIDHTPEPWSYGAGGELEILIRAEEVDGQPYLGRLFTLDLPAAANARRIVACVNACAGIPTEALEAFARKGVLGQLWRDEWERAFNHDHDHDKEGI